MIDATAEDIREMRTHSSSVIARKAAEALYSVTELDVITAEEFIQAVERNSRILRQANPSHAWLQSSQRSIVNELKDSSPETPEEARRALTDIVTETVESITSATDEAGAHAAELLNTNDTILTHDYSSTVLAALRKRAEQGDSFSVIVTEARPRLIGRRMARALGTIEGIDVTLIVDNAAGLFLKECDRVIVGMDCIVNDVLYNRVGTFPITSLAAVHGVGVTVTGAAAKIVDDAFVFENEHRDPVEVMLEPSPEFSIANPPYDATPIDLIDTIATDEGIHHV